MSFLCGVCLDGMKPYPRGCPECGAAQRHRKMVAEDIMPLPTDGATPAPPKVRTP